VDNEMLMSIDIGPNLMIAAIAIALIFAVAWLLRRAIQMRVIHSRSS
jgi:flagellar biogenesis protein FliO